MRKIVITLILAVFFFGCSAPVPKPTKQHTPPQKQHKHAVKQMFQSVSPQQAILVQHGKDKISCAHCGMNLVKFYKTNHSATYEDKPIQYCSLHCLAQHLKEGAEVQNPMVVGVDTLKFLPVLEAYYVVGSSKRGTMSRVSKYAFSSLDAAEQFQKQYGGKIVDFRAALEEAKKDFR